MQQRQRDITEHRDGNVAKGISNPTPEAVIREQTRAMTILEKDILHETQISNRLGTANRKVAVFYIATGSGVHNTDLRRTSALQNYIPAALLDPSVNIV